MSTLSSREKVLLANAEALREAARVLRDGGLVVFPTDTVYGLGADPYNAEAVDRVYQIKGRDTSKPLQLLLSDVSQLPLVAVEISDLAWRIARQFLPGGITLVLKKAPQVPSTVAAQGETVGVRVPAHPLCCALIQAFGGPVAATSANRSGQPSPRTAQEAVEQIGDLVDLALDGGPCPLGQESTVLDLSVSTPRLLREGAISKATLEQVIGATFEPAQ